MRRTISFKGAFGLVSVCLLALYGVNAVRSDHTWNGIPPVDPIAQQDSTHDELTYMPEVFGPFDERDMLQPLASMSVLSTRSERGFLPDGLKALYLSEYEDDIRALQV